MFTMHFNTSKVYSKVYCMIKSSINVKSTECYYTLNVKLTMVVHAPCCPATVEIQVGAQKLETNLDNTARYPFL